MADFSEAAAAIALQAFFDDSSTTPKARMLLFKFLEDRPSFTTPDSLIPTIDLELRLEMIDDIRENFEKMKGQQFFFTKLQLSALLIMPLDSLRAIQQDPALILTFLPTELYPRFSKSNHITPHYISIAY